MHDINFQLKAFDELSSSDLYLILQLRSAVFVLEQNCAYQDIDDLDLNAQHLCVFTDSKLSAYARILKPEQCDHRYCSIGRVVVAQKYRHEKMGHALMQEAINCCLRHHFKHPIKISAQSYLTEFYQDLGFINTGHFYLEDQIPHQEMLYQPK